ncbi:MAG: DNA polymerase III subunit alpha [Candidatus Shikimatogenerans bostrichidophilus]|nr:MAG: DNA polymerase III subunit alpha [Candidatus Shikimatogenerans bostrichidophilus]
MNKALEYNMKAVGITDNNMMGSYYFLEKIYNINNKFKKKIIKGIIGCEIFIKKKDKLFNYVLIAKNKIGYYNLIKICSYGYINNENIYYINKNIIKKYYKGLILLISTYKSEISYYIIKNKINKAEKKLLYWKNIFKDDIYIELFKNGLKYENKINEYLVKFSKKNNIYFINQNYTFFLNKSDYEIYNILLCIKNKEKKNIINKKKNYYNLLNKEFYFKKYSVIKKKFKNLKEGFKNLNKIYKKIEYYIIEKKNLLPKFKIPKNEIKKIKKKKNFYYLKYITYKGAKKKYLKLNNKIKNRINKELKIIKKKKFEDYFLIVYDIINKAKKNNIYIGPGRGSVAGSIVSYCIDITRIDPLKYNLIFERFLNIDRINMPDIDIDLDNKGRNKIILYLKKKYGFFNVSNIITYGKIGSKLAIKDTSRVLNLSLKRANKLSNNLIKNFTLNQILDNDISFFNKKLSYQDYNKVLLLKKIYNYKNSLESKVLDKAKLLEGLIRNTSIHACGIIISKNNIMKNIPVMYNNKNNMLLTQYDTYCIEKIGLLKIDLLSLKILNIIKKTINKIKNRNIKIKKLNLNDKKTLNLFKKGYTIGIFQYDSLGMKKYLKLLKPNNFNDLISINALYRPGTIKYIYNFILRKNHKEKITYDLPIMKKYLNETYGITIFQEQVILVARKLSGISKIEADNIREAISKKKINKLKKLKKKFFIKSIINGYSIKKLKKIWKDWENFSLYAFNKSHATCYTYISFITAFLKTHYKIEYMCSLLSNNINKYKNLKLFLKESNKLNIKILKPDINFSKKKFSIVNNKILFGIEAIKGIGKVSINLIIKERKKKKFVSFVDFITRINLRVINKKIIKLLILSGSLDSLGIKKYFFLLKKKKKKNYSYLEYFLNKINNVKKKINKKNIKKYLKKIKKKNEKNEKNYKIYYKKKQNKILGFNINKNILLKYYKFEINFFKLNNLNFLFKKKIKFIYGIINKISLLYNNNYSIILEDKNLYKKEIYISKKKYLKYKNILKKNFVIIIKLKFFNKKINILKIININNIYDNYNYLFIIMYKNYLYKKNKKIIKLINNKIKKKYYSNKKIIFIIKNNNNDNKVLYKKIIYNVKYNKKIIKNIINIPKIKFFLCKKKIF